MNGKFICLQSDQRNSETVSNELKIYSGLLKSSFEITVIGQIHFLNEGGLLEESTH